MKRTLVFFCVLVCSACGPGADERSGGDEKRTTAVEIPFGEVLDDRVSEDDGDATDWKRFELDRPAQVNVAVYWDRDDVEARIELRDLYGALVGEQKHRDGAPVDVVSAQLEPGEYFVAIRAEGVGSVYSLELSTGQVTGPAGAPADMLRPGQEPRPE